MHTRLYIVSSAALADRYPVIPRYITAHWSTGVQRRVFPPVVHWRKKVGSGGRWCLINQNVCCSKTFIRLITMYFILSYRTTDIPAGIPSGNSQTKDESRLLETILRSLVILRKEKTTVAKVIDGHNLKSSSLLDLRLCPEPDWPPANWFSGVTVATNVLTLPCFRSVFDPICFYKPSPENHDDDPRALLSDCSELDMVIRHI